MLPTPSEGLRPGRPGETRRLSHARTFTAGVGTPRRDARHAVDQQLGGRVRQAPRGSPFDAHALGEVRRGPARSAGHDASGPDEGRLRPRGCRHRTGPGAGAPVSHARTDRRDPACTNRAGQLGAVAPRSARRVHGTCCIGGVDHGQRPESDPGVRRHELLDRLPSSRAARDPDCGQPGLRRRGGQHLADRLVAYRCLARSPDPIRRPRQLLPRADGLSVHRSAPRLRHLEQPLVPLRVRRRRVRQHPDLHRDIGHLGPHRRMEHHPGRHGYRRH
jgi:hypothetical protein